MTSAFQSIGASLAPIAASGPAATPPPPGVMGISGQFSFKPDEIRAIVKDWEDLATSYGESLSNARELTQVEGPGREYASEFHAARASESGQEYLRSLTEKIEYCRLQARKFQAALDGYTGADSGGRRVIDKAGESGVPLTSPTSGGI